MKNHLNCHRSLAILFVSSLLAAGGAAVGQEAEQGGPDRMLRLLALGDPPPWAEINDGVRRTQRDPAPGSVPPQEVVQGDPNGAEVGDPVRLGLGQVSAGLPVSGSVALFDVKEIGAGVQPWVRLTMPPGKSHGLAVLWRDFAEKKWTKADSLVLPEDLTSFPAGSIRFVNVSHLTAEFSIAGQVVKLERGKHATSQPRAAFKDQPLEVHVVAPGGAKMKIADQEINQGAGQRTTIFTYTADGEKNRMPAKLKVVLENTRALPQLPRR